MMNDKSTFPLRLDTRPLDKGQFSPYGYGYSRKVNKQELWRPAIKYIVRDETQPKRYRIIKLLPGYYCSDHGRIFSTTKQGIITDNRSHKRRRTQLYDENGEAVPIRPYKLLLDNWVMPPEHLQSVVYCLMDSVNHVDGCCWRDRLDNIEYSPKSVNVEHQVCVLSGRKKKTRKNEAMRSPQRNAL